MGTGRLHRWWLTHWFDPAPTWLAVCAQPLAGVYGCLAARNRTRQQAQARGSAGAAPPVIVVGNLVVGGAGKTPTTVAIVQALQRAGRRPGVLSRGHGRATGGVTPIDADSPASEGGDEPVLIARRTGVPVVVGRDRVAARESLLHAHPEVDVIVSDDGLQHRSLARELEVLVFDDRGIGNGRLLPAGPLREPFAPTPPTRSLVLYTEGRRSTAWPGHLARRVLVGVTALAPWARGDAETQPLTSLCGRRVLAMAGLAVPERFFAALEAAGLEIERLPLPDHHRYRAAPWPPSAREIVTTEKDAVKLQPWIAAGPRIWVVRLDLQLPPAFEDELLERVSNPTRT